MISCELFEKGAVFLNYSMNNILFYTARQGFDSTHFGVGFLCLHLCPQLRWGLFTLNSWGVVIGMAYQD